MKITRALLRQWGACYSDKRIAELVPEEGLAPSAVAELDLPKADVVWVLCHAEVVGLQGLAVFAKGCATYAADAATYAADAAAAAAAYAATYAAAYAARATYAAAATADAANYATERTRQVKHLLELAQLHTQEETSK